MRTSRRLLTMAALISAVFLGWSISASASVFPFPVTRALWVAAPLCAALCCLFAARASSGSERHAWACFAAGCGLWLAGILVTIASRRQGADFAHPGAADIGYLLGTICFIPGMFLYTGGRTADRRVEFWNFALLASGGALAIFALSLSAIANSQLSTLGTALALAYPAIWVSAAGTGLVTLVFYVEPTRRLELLLIVSSLSLHAGSDLAFAHALMSDNYREGSLLDASWLVGFFLFACAAGERCLRGTDKPVGLPAAPGIRRRAEALFAATIVAAVSIAIAISGALLGHPVALLAIPVACVYAIALGAREYLALSIERGLRQSAEANVHQLQESERQLASVLESTTDSVVALDRDWNITFINRRAKETIGRLRHLEVGQNLWERFPEEIGGPLEEQYRQAVALQRPVDVEEYLPSLGIWLEAHAFPTADGLSIFFRDVTARKGAQQEIVRLAYHDALTGLGNRALFKTKLEQCLEDRTKGAALMCLDLDHFKEVNDSYGHNVGDQLLQEVSRRLTETAPEHATLARLGGDEFAILLPGPIDPGALDALAQKLIAALSRSYGLENLSISIGSSVGMALFPDHASAPDELLKNADAALYFAKSSGRGRALSFRPEMAERMRWKQALRTDLADATAQGQFHLVYQPIIELATSRVSGFEALIRWRHPERGEVSPSEFIPVAEESGLITQIGAWALEASCREAASWPPSLGISVNLSAVQFRDDKLPGHVERVLKMTGMEPNRLCLEVTETVLLDNQEQASRILRALRKLGVRISLDDFGTGYSSLSYLRTYPLDTIKLDGSFVAEHESATSRAIIGAVVDIAKTLGSSIVAEGVETRQQLDAIRREGCTHAQGYFFSRPVAPHDVPSTWQHIEETAIWWTDQTRRA